MDKSFKIIKNKRYSFTSKYNVKLYKKCLSLKLIFIDKKFNLPNLIINKSNQVSLKFIKIIFSRREKIPFRLLSSFSY